MAPQGQAILPTVRQPFISFLAALRWIEQMGFYAYTISDAVSHQ